MVLVCFFFLCNFCYGQGCDFLFVIFMLMSNMNLHRKSRAHDTKYTMWKSLKFLLNNSKSQFQHYLLYLPLLELYFTDILFFL